MKVFYLFFLCTIVYTTSTDWENLRKLITRNETKEWLGNLRPNNTSPYCRLCCVNISSNVIGKSCGTHTLCKFLDGQPGPNCKGFINVHFTDAEKRAILDVHNTLRNKVALGEETRGSPGPQPKAANMRLVTWNEELGLIAERWAAQCVFTHDRCRDTASYPVGQNLAKGNLAMNNELSLVEEWYNQVEHLNKTEVSAFNLTETGGHTVAGYTQIVWGDTYLIGCARAIFQEFLGPNITYQEHLICNYGPSGNIPNQPIYRIGEPCSFCQQGTTCSLEYTALCENGEGDPNAIKFRANNSSQVNKYSIAVMLSVYIFYIFFLYIKF